MIIWFVDRFGLPGSYQRIWVRMLAEQGVNAKDVRVLSLHKMANRQLLTKYGARKAPTWIPDEGPRILQQIDHIVEKAKPQAVVLAAPEALACLGLHPEFATLHNLRGSVYWRNGVPHLVMLPISAWNSLVSQKEIGAANYGYESQDTFIAAQASSGGDSSDREHSGAGSPNGAVDLHKGKRGPSGDADPREVHAQLQAQSHGANSGRDNRDDGASQADRPGHEGSSTGGDRRVGHDSGTDLDMGEEGVDGTDVSDDLDRSDEDSVGDSNGDGRNVDAEEADENADSVDDSDDGENMDKFFYEPVLSPVGRFVLIADTQKLKRLLTSGKKANGPTRPPTIKWN